MIEQGVLNLLLGNPVAVGTRPDGSDRSVYQALFVAAVGMSVFPGKAPQSLELPLWTTVAKSAAMHQKHTQGVSGLAKTKVTVKIYHQILRHGGTAGRLRPQASWTATAGRWRTAWSCQGIFQDDDSNHWQEPVHADEQGVEAAVLLLTVVSNET